jgi:hypothetical protein
MHGQMPFKQSHIRKPILKLTSKLPAYNDSLMTEHLQGTYDTVFKIATDNELYELTNHPSPLVRRSSFYTLLERYSPMVLNLLEKNAGDTTEYFQVQYGCLIENQTFIDEVLFYLSPESGWNRNFKMTTAQKRKVTAMLTQREKARQAYLMNH